MRQDPAAGGGGQGHPAEGPRCSREPPGAVTRLCRALLPGVPETPLLPVQLRLC